MTIAKGAIMVRPGEPPSQGDDLLEQLKRMGLSDLTIGSLAARPTSGSDVARALRILIFNRATGPAGPTPWGIIGERTLARGWASTDVSSSRQVISGPDTSQQLAPGEHWVLVPQLPPDELIFFAWQWLEDMLALLDIHLDMSERVYYPGRCALITPGSTFNYKWVIINAQGPDLAWEDEGNAGAEGILLLAQHPFLLLKALQDDLGRSWIFKGIRLASYVGQPDEDWGCLEFRSSMTGGSRRLHLRVKSGETGLHPGRLARHITMRTL